MRKKSFTCITLLHTTISVKLEQAYCDKDVVEYICHGRLLSLFVSVQKFYNRTKLWKAETVRIETIQDPNTQTIKKDN